MEQQNSDVRAAVATLLFGGDFCPIGRYEKGILTTGTAFDEALIRIFRAHRFSRVNLEAPLCVRDIPADNPGGFGSPYVAKGGWRPSALYLGGVH